MTIRLVMHISEIEQIIDRSLEDFKFDDDEKKIFKALSVTISDDQRRFIQNKSFELSKPYIEKGGTEAIRVLNWLERIIKAIQPAEELSGIKSSAYFSPGESCRNKIINLIKESKHALNICVFTISDNRITESIVRAHERGVEVTIISDNDKANDRGSDIDMLSDKGINVILDNTSYHMHHKFMLVDGKALLSGSFNWTRSASEYNEENLLVTYDKELVSLYGNEFEKLKIKLSS